jgi:hypothetical protein
LRVELLLLQVDGNRSISLDLFRKSLSLSRRSADLLGQARMLTNADEC